MVSAAINFTIAPGRLKNLSNEWSEKELDKEKNIAVEKAAA